SGTYPKNLLPDRSPRVRPARHLDDSSRSDRAGGGRDLAEFPVARPGIANSDFSGECAAFGTLVSGLSTVWIFVSADLRLVRRRGLSERRGRGAAAATWLPARSDSRRGQHEI